MSWSSASPWESRSPTFIVLALGTGTLVIGLAVALASLAALLLGAGTILVNQAG